MPSRSLGCQLPANRMFVDGLLQSRGLKRRLRRLGRAGPRSTTALPFEGARKLGVLVTVLELPTDVDHPNTIVIFTHPVVATNADHGPAKLALPALTIRAIRRKGFTVDIGYAAHATHARHGRVAAMRRKRSVTGKGHIEAQGLTGKGEHHEN